MFASGSEVPEASKETAPPVCGTAGEYVNAAVGPTTTRRVCDAEPVRPVSSVTVRPTVNVPYSEYVWNAMRPAPVSPSPKVHAYEMIVPSSREADPSNWTWSPTIGLAGAVVKDAFGGPPARGRASSVEREDVGSERQRGPRHHRPPNRDPPP